MVTKSMQDHEAAAGSGDPNVQYAHEDGIASVEAKYIRPASVTYPGPSARRVVYYNYPTSGVGAALGRLDNIASVQNTSTASEKFVAYSYFGASTVLKVAYPAVTGGLALTYAGSTSGDYSGFDRFGRVVWQRWLRTDGSAADRYFYGYDRAGNRRWRAERADLSNAGSRDEAYVYDGLDRLIGAKRGILPDKPYQAPYPADADMDGVVDAGDYMTVKGNLGGSSMLWTQGDFDGTGTCDWSDLQILMANFGNPAESIAKQWLWTLDPVGNWSGFKSSGATTQPWDLDQARLHNKANEIEDTVNQTPNAISGTPDWVDPAYDLAGNMIAGPQPRYETADANTQLYVYDAWNRLTKIYQDANCNDTIDDPSELVVTYSYDGQNRRIRKVVEAGESDITYDYYYNESWQVLEVRKGGDTDPLEQYVWGVQYIDAPIVRFRDGNVDGDLLDTQNNVDSTLYYTYDGNFNVTALVKPDGTVAERYTYDPYGQVTFKAADWSDAASQAKSAYDNEILYCGYRFDPESGNYLARRRYLTPPLGRWLTTDPIVYGDGMNWYQYVGGNPMKHIDPLGYVSISTDSTGVTTISGDGWSGSFGPNGGTVSYSGTFLAFHFGGIDLDFHGSLQLSAKAVALSRAACTNIIPIFPSISIPSFSINWFPPGFTATINVNFGAVLSHSAEVEYLTYVYKEVIKNHFVDSVTLNVWSCGVCVQLSGSADLYSEEEINKLEVGAVVVVIILAPEAIAAPIMPGLRKLAVGM